MKKQHKQTFGLIVAIAGALALTACGKKEEPTPTPPPPMEAPAPAPAPTTPPPAATPAPAAVTVSSVDLGTAVGPDQKVTSPSTEFAPTDTIYAAVSTSGSASSAVSRSTTTRRREL